MGLFNRKQFKCETCGAKFAKQTELMDHGIMHMNSSPTGGSSVTVGDSPANEHGHVHLKCSACGAEFHTQEELMHHAKTTHSM